MNSTSRSAAKTRHRQAVALVIGGALMLAPIAQRPAWSQTAAPAGSTINGTVPTSQGNVWNGLDHQPTPAEVGTSGTAKQQARINHKLSKLDQQLLDDPLPKVPAGAPSVGSN